MVSNKSCSGNSIIFEFITMGAVVKVSAIDPATDTEVSIMGPANESPELLKATALRKLQYMKDKKAT